MSIIPVRMANLGQVRHAIDTHSQHALRRVVSLSAGLASMAAMAVLVAWSLGRWRLTPLGNDEIAVPAGAALLLVAVVALASAGVGAAAVLRGAFAEIRQGQALAERVTLLMNSANDAMFVVDERGRIVEANDRAVESYGYTRVELEKMTVLDLRAPETRSTYERQAGEVRARGHVVYETVHRRKDGSSFPVEASVGRLEIGSALYALGVVRDITDRKRAQEALDLEQRLLNGLMSAIPDCIYFKDRQSRFLRINDAHARRFGLGDPAGAVGRTDRDFFSEEHAEQAYADEQRVMATGQALVGIEEKETWPDGHVTWVSTTKVPTFDASGKVSGLMGVSRDITAHRDAEEALANERALLRAVIDLLPALVYAKDTDCRKILSNPVDLKFMGAASEAEVLGKTDFDFYAEDVAARFYARDQEIIRTGKPLLNHEHTIVAPDGQERWLITSKVQLRDAAGHVIGLVGVGQDITERRRAEEALRLSEARFRSVFNAALDGILLADAETGAFLMANPAICEMLGYAEEELLRLGVEDIHPAANVADVKEVFRRQAAGELRLAPGTPVKRRDGSTFVADISARPFVMGERKSLVGVFRDTTALSEMETQMRQSQKMEAIGLLAGGVAHDFNNILGVILGHCELTLKNLKEADPLSRSLRQIRANAERAAGLTRQLLAFSRRQTLVPVVMDLNATVRGLSDMLRRLIGEDVDITTRLAEELGRVKADPGQIEQVIINLAVNARDAMPTGGKLLLQTTNADQERVYAQGPVRIPAGHYVLLTMTDTGCGMDARVRERVFEPFFTTKEKGRGTGLGLSTVYGIVKQSGGYVLVDSEPGRGTTFSIYLPRTDEAVLERLAKVQPAESGGRGERILVVEDEEGMREIIQEVLGDLGYKVTTAAGGGEALLAVEEGHLIPDLLITDVVMPGMSGTLLVERLQRALPNLRVLYMSGYAENGTAHQGVAETNAPFIQKPFRIDDLAAKVRTALGGRGA